MKVVLQTMDLGNENEDTKVIKEETLAKDADIRTALKLLLEFCEKHDNVVLPDDNIDYLDSYYVDANGHEMVTEIMIVKE